MGLPADTPTTDSALFDVLHQMFGIGDFDETGEIPWWRFRQVEISKIKRHRASRDLSLAELYVAALYAKAHGHDIRAVTWLAKYITPAKKWRAERDAKNEAADFENEYAGAIAASIAEGDTAWTERLSRAQGEARQEVLAAWRTDVQTS